MDRVARVEALNWSFLITILVNLDHFKATLSYFMALAVLNSEFANVLNDSLSIQREQLNKMAVTINR